MKDIFHDPEQMMMMDYADEADRKGLDIWEFSTLEELLDALRDADRDALFSASCDDDDYDDYDYYDVNEDDDDDDEDEDDDGDYNVDGYDVDDYDEDEEDEDEDDDDEVDSFYFDHVIASLSKPDLTAHTSLSSQPSPAAQAAQTSQSTQSAQTSQSAQESQSVQVSQSAQESRVSQEPPAPSRPVREPRRPEMPERPGTSVASAIFYLYLVFTALGHYILITDLISRGGTEIWKDWAVEIFSIIFLWILPLLLYIFDYKYNSMPDYKKNMKKYEAEMIVYEKRLEAYEKFTRGETADKSDFDKAGGPSQAQQDAQMKKALILMGSPRKNGNTASLAKPFISTLSEAGFHCETVWLCDLDIRPCLACRACQLNHTKAACVQQDDMAGLYDQVLACDLLILATPIYSWYCTPPMKAALDRLVYGLNKYYGSSKGPSLWAGKKVALIVTCGYPPEKGADLFAEGIRRYCRHSQLEYAGMLAERHLGYDTVFMDEEKAARAKAFAEEVAGTAAKEQPAGGGSPTR